MVVIPYEQTESGAEGELVGTNLRRKYRRAGRAVLLIAAQRAKTG